MGGGIHRNLESMSAKDIKTVDEESAAKVASISFTSQIETQRAVFQRNIDALNQTYRQNVEQNQNSLKKDEKAFLELHVEKNSQFSEADDENKRPNPLSAYQAEIVTKAPLSFGQPSSMLAELTNQKSTPSQASSVQDSLLEDCSAVEDKLSAQNKSPTRSVEPQVEIQEPKVQQKPETPKQEISELLEEPLTATDACNLENKVIAAIRIDSAEAKPDIKPPLQEPVMLCLVEGENKENVSPIILEEIVDKSEHLDAEAMAIEEPVRASEFTMMDQDKEPVFAEENLQQGSSVIVDEESLSCKDRSTPEDCIFEVEKMVLDGDRDVTPMKALDSAVDVQQASTAVVGEQVDLVQVIMSQATQLKNEAKENAKQLSDRKGSKPAIKIINNRVSRLNLPSSIGMNTPRINMSVQKPMINIAKRPPMVTSESARKPQTPYQSTKETTRPVFKTLSAVKERMSPFNNRAERKSSFKERDNSASQAHRSSEKVSRKPSVPKFFNQTPKKACPLLSDAKVCTEIAARLAEAEQVLQLKKPPVPKFSIMAKPSAKKTQENPLLETPRKPPVPKLCELFKKK